MNEFRDLIETSHNTTGIYKKMSNVGHVFLFDNSMVIQIHSHSVKFYSNAK